MDLGETIDAVAGVSIAAKGVRHPSMDSIIRAELIERQKEMSERILPFGGTSFALGAWCGFSLD